MKNILFINRKGGTGKSTCSIELIRSLQRSGIALNFYDLDGQGGTIFETFEEPGAKVSVIDCPGRLEDDTAKLISDADVVVVPTLASVLDTSGLMLILDSYKQYRKKGAKCVIVLNRYTRFTNNADFMKFLQEEAIDGIKIATLQQSEMIPQAYAKGISVVDYKPKSSIAKSAIAMANVIRTAIGIPEE